MATICSAKYRWTRDELVRAMQHHQTLRIRRGVALFMKVSAIILLAFLGLLTLLWLLDPSAFNPPIWTMIVLAVVGLYGLASDKLNVWLWTRGFNKRPDAGVQILWQFSPEEIYIETDLGKTTVTWKSFLKVVETKDGFLFYSLDKLFHWLPFSAFESPDCVGKVRELVTNNGF